jgi:hypothetical protein
MPQMTVWRPFGELDLGHELGPEPTAVLHYLLLLVLRPTGTESLEQQITRAGVEG